MSYGIKKVRKDLLKSKKFEQLGLGFSNLDTAIIERKAIKKSRLYLVFTGAALIFYLSFQEGKIGLFSS